MLCSHNQTRRRLGDNPQRGLSFTGTNHNVPLVLAPFCRLLDVAVIRPWNEHTRSSIGFESKAFTRPPRKRDVILFRPINSPLRTIFLEHMHPRRVKELVPLRVFPFYCHP